MVLILSTAGFIGWRAYTASHTPTTARSHGAPPDRLKKPSSKLKGMAKARSFFFAVRQSKT